MKPGEPRIAVDSTNTSAQSRIASSGSAAAIYAASGNEVDRAVVFQQLPTFLSRVRKLFENFLGTRNLAPSFTANMVAGSMP